MAAGGATKPLGKLHVGTAGFSCAHWAGEFYPRGAKNNADMMLECFQENLSIVELNSSFYGTPSSSTVRNWKQRSAKGFAMSWKVVKSVTHEGRMDSNAAISSLQHFLNRAKELGSEHLAVLLFQCPRTLRVDAAQIDALHEAIQESGVSCRVAVEVRHPECELDQKFLDALKARNWAFVIHPDSVGRATARPRHDDGQTLGYGKLEPLRTDLITADFVYIRLHGDNDEHTYRYSEDELKAHAEQIHRWRSAGLDVYCFFLNDDAKAAMPQNAVRMRQLAHALAGEPLPRTPKQASNKSISSFFKPAAKSVVKGVALKTDARVGTEAKADAGVKVDVEATKAPECDLEGVEPQNKKPRMA
eukprot:TRINITY_DN930_c1_g1_i1.p1 TRINITY_DN930_c1_g1~~TRINITY_DN930_c1_g1_i1.p1  ORF type:complete len:360 (-),score=43.78 TRINITY_DN930_c1_g1_i1:178-1257(-)